MRREPAERPCHEPSCGQYEPGGVSLGTGPGEYCGMRRVVLGLGARPCLNALDGSVRRNASTKQAQRAGLEGVCSRLGLWGRADHASLDTAVMCKRANVQPLWEDRK